MSAICMTVTRYCNYRRIPRCPRRCCCTQGTPHRNLLALRWPSLLRRIAAGAGPGARYTFAGKGKRFELWQQQDDQDSGQHLYVRKSKVFSEPVFG